MASAQTSAVDAVASRPETAHLKGPANTADGGLDVPTPRRSR